MTEKMLFDKLEEGERSLIERNHRVVRVEGLSAVARRGFMLTPYASTFQSLHWYVSSVWHVPALLFSGQIDA